MAESLRFVRRTQHTGRSKEGGVLVLPLTMCRAGEVAFIKKISGRDEVRQHLAELGFVVGEKVTVVSELAGNLIVQVKESRVALSKDMACRVMV